MSLSLAVLRRYLTKEMEELSKTLLRDTNGQVEVLSCENDELAVRFTFRISPKRGPYSHAAFTFTLDFTNDRRGHFPYITTLDHIYHPNIIATDGDVEICVNLLDNWSIHMGIRAIVYSLLFLFCEPNYDDILDDEFVVPEEMTKEEAIRLALSGGCIFTVKHEPNKAWLAWWEKRHTRDPNTIEDKQEASTKIAELQSHNMGSRRSSAKSSYRQYISSDLLATSSPKQVSTQTVYLSEIAIVQFKVQPEERGRNYHYFFAENCLVKERQWWEEVNEARLNQKPDRDRYEFRQEAHTFPWEVYESELRQSEGIGSETLVPNSFFSKPNLIHKSDEHLEIQATYRKDSRLLTTLYPRNWFLYQTRWPSYLSPGSRLSNSLLCLDWSSSSSYASAGQLFNDLSRLLHSRKWTPFSQLLLIDPLALSPTSPVINRLLFEPSVENTTVDGLVIDCAEWISLHQAVTLKLNQWGLRHRLPGQTVLCVLAFLHNWAAYLSRCELHHTCFGFSRPGTTAFSVTRRTTDPFTLSILTPALLPCGQTPLFDAWPMWVTKSFFRLSLHGATKLIQLFNRHYFKCTTSVIADRRGKTAPNFVSFLAFTDIEDL